MKEQGVYQQLRSHLAYLRLGAAAEQLARLAARGLRSPMSPPTGARACPGLVDSYPRTFNT
jgi:hypothetical protein